VGEEWRGRGREGIENDGRTGEPRAGSRGKGWDGMMGWEGCRGMERGWERKDGKGRGGRDEEGCEGIGRKGREGEEMVGRKGFWSRNGL
jgi:hypothetical protein